MVGNISRPGRAATSCACGALIKSLGEIKRDGLVCSCKQPGGARAAAAAPALLVPPLRLALVCAGWQPCGTPSTFLLPSPGPVHSPYRLLPPFPATRHAVHDPEDIEYSILKQRLARRLEFEGLTDADLERLDLVGLTQVRP